MKIVSTTIFQHLNIYDSKPVIRMTVDFGELGDRSTGTFSENFIECLFAKLPELDRPDPGRQVQSDFSRRLRDGEAVLLPEIVWRSALAYQRRAGDRASYGAQFETSERGTREVVYEYRDANLGRRAGRLALGLVHHLAAAELGGIGKSPTSFNFDVGRGTVRWLNRGRPIDINTAYLLEAADRRGVPWTRIDRQIAVLGYGNRRRHIWTAATELLTHVDYKMTEDKVITVQVLADLGLPVPTQIVARSETDAIAAAQRIGFPVVVKPRDAHTGRGVSTNLQTSEEVASAYNAALEFSQGIIVETFLEGEDHRLLVINGEMVAAVQRLPAQVVGDGKHSIEELIGIENQKRRARGRGAKYNLKLDAITEWHLGRAETDRNAVPSKSKIVRLRSASNYSQGGTAHDVTDLVHPENKAMAVRAARAFSMDIAGVDFMTTDISRSYLETGGTICEVGSRPGLLLHIEPDEGQPRDVALPAIDMLMPGGSVGHIPIAVIASASGGRRGAAILAHILMLAGQTTGLSMRTGTFVAGQRASADSVTGGRGARMVLNDSAVETAVLETRFDDIAKTGVGCDSFLACAILNATTKPSAIPDTATFEQLLDRLVSATRGAVILDGDDEGCIKLAKRHADAEFWFFTEKSDNGFVREQIRRGRSAALLETIEGEASLAIYHAGALALTMPKKDIQIEASASAQRHIVRQALYAVALAWKMGADTESIRLGIRTLSQDVLDKPLRAQMVDDLTGRVLVGELPDAVAGERLGDILSNISAKGRLIVTIVAPAKYIGDAILGIAAGSETEIDLYVCCDPATEARLSAAGVPNERIHTLSSDTEAVTYALDGARPGDAIGIICDDLYRALRRIQSYRDRPAYAATFGLDTPVVGRQTDKVTAAVLSRAAPALERKGGAPRPLWTGAEVTAATGGEWIQGDPNTVSATGYCHSIQKITPGDLFLTTNPDQWQWKPSLSYPDLINQLPEIAADGAAAIIVHRRPKAIPPGVPILLVEDTHVALNQLAQAARERFQGQVTCVIGSVGKTTTREALRHVLSKQGPTLATVENYNHRVGLSATIARTPQDLSYAIYETSMPARPKSLIARPDVAIITTIEPEHLQYYFTVEGIADDKAKIFDGLVPGGTGVLNRDTPMYERLRVAAERKDVKRIVTFGIHPEADVRLANSTVRPTGSTVEAVVHGEPITYECLLPGHHVILNTLGVLAVVEALDADWKQAAADIATMTSLPQRLEREQVAIEGGQINFIDDGFSTNPASLKAGLEYLRIVKPEGRGRRIAILGEIRELGLQSAAIHAELAEAVVASGADLVFTTGDDMQFLADALPSKLRGAHSNDPVELSGAVVDTLRPDDVVYLKGSRRSIESIAHITKVVRSLGDAQALATLLKPDRLSPAIQKPQKSKDETDFVFEPDISLADTKRRRQLELLFVGDTGFGENYQLGYEQKGRGNILKDKGYDYPLEKLRAALEAPDLVIANLETPVTNIAVSPFAEEKQYVHWADIEKTPDSLRAHNIRVVGLANNHTFDYGREGFEQTLTVLKDKGFSYFGAGRDQASAARPFMSEFIIGKRRLRLAALSAFELNSVYRDKYQVYASKNAGGVNPLRAKRIARQIDAIKRADPSIFVIVYPHWGANYRWRSEGQAKIADTLIAAGADLIIGHGAHMLQEVEQRGGRWIVYSIGNFMFNSLGRYKKLNAPPFGLVANLVVQEAGEGLAGTLKLHPIFTDNRRNGYQSRFISPAEFDEVRELLIHHSPIPAYFEQAVTWVRDDPAPYLELDLGKIASSKAK